MAVVCACIPSLRPLLDVLGCGSSSKAVTTSLNSTRIISPSNLVWSGGGKQSNGNFSQLGELDDLTPLGHEVSVHGGGGGSSPGQYKESVSELPRKGIKVETEITLSTSDRIYYNDRLF